MTMLNRRTLFASTMAVATAAKEAVLGRSAEAALPKDVEPRGTVGRLERLPRLDLESQHDFITGFRQFVNVDMNRAAEAAAALMGGEPGSTTSRASRSASITTAPCAASRSATVDFPDAIPPVSPTSTVDPLIRSSSSVGRRCPARLRTA